MKEQSTPAKRGRIGSGLVGALGGLVLVIVIVLHEGGDSHVRRSQSRCLFLESPIVFDCHTPFFEDRRLGKIAR